MNFIGCITSKKRLYSKIVNKRFPDAKMGDAIANIVYGKRNRREYDIVKIGPKEWIWISLEVE